MKARKARFTFNVQAVPVGEILHYGVPFRERYFLFYERDNLTECPFMFDPMREIVLFPDTVPVNIQKKAVRILLRVINRSTMDSKSQTSDYDKLDTLFNGDTATYAHVSDMFGHYYAKRNKLPYANRHFNDWTCVFIRAEYKNLKAFNAMRKYHFQTASDFLAGNDTYYTYKQ